MKSSIAASIACFFFLALPAAAQPQENERGQRLASFEMTWARPAPQAVAARARAAAEVIAGRRLERPATAVSPKSAGAELRRIRFRVPDAPALEVVYLPEYDELRIADRELAASTSPTKEIPQDEALRLARRTFETLAERKLLDPGQFNWDKAEIASTWAGGGPSDAKERMERHRLEYRVTLRRSLNGIEVANAGIRIAVHVSGRVSSLRLGGVSVASKPAAGGLEQPTGAGVWVQRRTTNTEMQSRFEREMVPARAKAHIAWSRVMYVMPENKRTALVQPLYAVSYSLEYPSEEGYTAVSRRRTIGFSLLDAKAAPIDLTPPVRIPPAEKLRKPAKP
jgi:hypothetical protein